MSKKHSFSQKQIALISFLSNFLLKTPCVHTYIWSKKRQFCQNYTLWPRKWIGCPFFGYLTKQICSNAHIFSTKKKRPFSNKTLLHAHILSKKRPFFQKRCALMSIFSKILSKTPCGHAHIWSKTSILSKYTIIWAKKVNMMPFFSDFSRKNYRSHVKNVHSPKSTLLSSLVFVKKTAILSKTLCSYDIFSTFSWQTPCFQDLIWSKKRQYCQNNSIILAQNV